MRRTIRPPVECSVTSNSRRKSGSTHESRQRARWISRAQFVSLLCLFTTSSQAISHHPQSFLTAIHGQSHEAQEIVKHFCSNCHAEQPLIALGAPRMGHAEDWKARLKQGPSLLWQHTNEGFHAMPARGGCFECTDEQLKKAILLLTGDPTLEFGND